MSVQVTFSTPSDHTPAKGTAGMQAHIGGVPTTVSAMMDAGKANGNNIVKKSIG